MYDLIIIGSGPGGYVSAIRASQLGMQTLVIEKENLGGTCLNWGCIPTKALLKSAHVYQEILSANNYGIIQANPPQLDMAAIVQRSRDVAAMMNKSIEFLFNKNKVSLVKGNAKLLLDHKVEVKDEQGNNSIYEGKNIIIATGSRARQIPSLPIDGKFILGYRDALILTKLPKNMVIVGSGAIGMEFADFYSSLGANVTIVEYLNRLLPLEDEEVSKTMERIFRKKKINVLTSSEVIKSEINNDRVNLTIQSPKGTQIIETDIVLSAVGIQANIEDIGLEDVNIKTNKGKIEVNTYYQTNREGYYAIGDVINTPALAHIASKEGIICVEKIAGLTPKTIDYQYFPSCIYTNPEIASFGLKEQEAINKGYTIKIGKIPFTANGKAKASGQTDGFVKLIFDQNNDKLLGAHLIGENVTEMISGLLVSHNLDATAKDIFESIHPHPTLSESIMEAAASSHNEAIHI
jgi:dihydrolipoamide dehydrogenase